MNAELRVLFYEAVKAFGASEGMAVSLPRVKGFKKPSGDRAEFVQAFPLPVKPVVESVDGLVRYRWLLQLSLYAKSGTGDVRTSRHADTLEQETFPLHSYLVGSNHTYQIIEPPFPAPSVDDDDGWFFIPVTFTVQTIH